MLDAMIRGQFSDEQCSAFPTTYRPVGLHEADIDLGYIGTQTRPANSPWVTTHLNQETRRAASWGAYRPLAYMRRS
jgi:hypothetical protein